MRPRSIATTAALGVALAGGALVARRSPARADGPPTMNPLYVTGLVYDGTRPLTGDHQVSAQLFDAQTDGMTRCVTRRVTANFVRGRFRLPLEGTCAAAVRAHPDLWLELRVDDSPPFVRSRVGVVPYALEAGRAAEASGALDARLRTLESPATDPECPPGYLRASDAPAGQVVCARGRDEVVRVEAGAEQFWIDRFEASVWTSADATGTQYGLRAGDYPSTFPANGEYTVPLFALSVRESPPSGYLSWFMADAACRAAGKRLPTNAEWTTAARGISAGCLTAGSAPRASNAGTLCVSAYGAQNLVGNVWEWTEEWQVQLGTPGAGAARRPWPAGFGQDLTVNLTSAPRSGAAMTTATAGLPAAVRRGGAFTSGARAGRLAYAVDAAPSATEATAGVRCVIGP